MKTLLPAVAALSILADPAAAQIRPRYPEAARAHTAAYLEAIGAGGYYSLNLEKITPTSMLYRLGATTGSFTDADNRTNGETAVIGTVGRIFRLSLPGGEPDSPIEVAGGVVLGTQSLGQGSTRESGGYAALVGALGFRSRRVDRGFLWRLTFTPLYNFTVHSNVMKKGYSPSVGGSLGWIF